eukprot:scaffold132205_cov33-Tisochrysis_lutea.AAC.8
MPGEWVVPSPQPHSRRASGENKGGLVPPNGRGQYKLDYFCTCTSASTEELANTQTTAVSSDA